MRAVDADFIIQEIDKLSLSPWARENPEKMEACSVIKDLCVRKAPTVFDAVEVAKQLDEAGRKMAEAKLPHNYYKAVSVKKATAIIEGGGVK